jgi:hypothetical protein
LLRQSVRQCGKQNAERKSPPDSVSRHRVIVPKMLDEHKLLSGEPGKRKADDAWIEKMCETILTSKLEDAAGSIAKALSEGFLPEHIGEAISLAANQLVLRQVGQWDGHYGKRVHGDSMGVHCSDATNAWRNIIRVSNRRNQAAGLMLAAMDVAQSAAYGSSKKGLEKTPWPRPEHLQGIKATTPAEILKELGGAIRENDQFRAMALAHLYSQSKADARPIFDLLLEFSISEDGRLHAEKYYRTAAEEFATTRPSFQWRQVIALARVLASSYGFSQSDKKEGRAPGYEEARKVLGLS